jgi:hypothetical protein
VKLRPSRQTCCCAGRVDFKRKYADNRFSRRSRREKTTPGWAQKNPDGDQINSIDPASLIFCPSRQIRTKFPLTRDAAVQKGGGRERNLHKNKEEPPRLIREHPIGLFRKTAFKPAVSAGLVPRSTRTIAH